jgi:hypothetical protein
MQSRRNAILLTLLAAVGATAPAWGEGGAGADLQAEREQARTHVAPRTDETPRWPRVRGDVLVELQLDGQRDGHSGDAFVKVEPALAIALTEQLSIEAGFVLEPVFDAPQGRYRWFDDEGFFVETLFLRWQRGRFALHAGKFNPGFGVGWDGVDFAEDYEITERIGFGGAIEFGNEAIGRHQLGTDVFFADTSLLSGSLLHDRGRTRRSDGGPSNTGLPESIALTLRGAEIPLLPGFTYNLGFANQHRDDVGGRSERDAVVGLGYSFARGDELVFELLSEYVHLHNAGGEAEDRDYFTQCAAAYWGGWNAALAYTGRWIRARGAERQRDLLFQASTGYAWEVGSGGRFGILGVDIAWRFVREGGIGRDGFGGRISYAIEF